MSAPMACMHINMNKVTRRLLRLVLCEKNSWMQRSCSVVSTHEPRGETDVVEKIIIPPKKRRDSLSVLKALASTVDQNVPGPAYGYVDDPYLLPTYVTNKKLFTLSKLAGKNAARYVIDNHPHIFVNDCAEPYIKAFDPKKISYVHPDPSEEALLERVGMRRVEDSITIYKQLKDSGETISQEAYIKLLDLLCVYNGKDPERTHNPEEYWASDRISRMKNKEIWKKHGVAEEVFNNLPEKTDAAYNSLLRGMIRYNDIHSAWSLYNEMKDKNIQVGVANYNGLIANLQFLEDTMKQKWLHVEAILGDMNTADVQPTLGTFNSVLTLLLNLRKYPKKYVHAMETLNEMKALNIEPSLGTWNLIVLMFYRDEDSDSKIIYSILDEIENKEFTFQHFEDVKFFLTSMSKNTNIIHDLDLAYRIDKFLNVGKNRDLIGGADNEHTYYSRFFSLICLYETIDKIIEWYDRHAPYEWSPNMQSFMELLKAVDLHGGKGYEFIPRMWSDITLQRLTHSEGIMEYLFLVMAKEKQNETLQDTYHTIVDQVLQLWKKQTDMKSRFRMVLSGNMIGDMIQICCNGGNITQARQVLDFYTQNAQFIPKMPSDKALLCLMNALVKEKDAANAIKCLKVMSDLCIGQIGELSLKLKNELPITEEQEKQIDAIA